VSGLIEKSFHEVWIVDFEFENPPGNLPSPVCVVAWELRSGKKIRLWKDQFTGMTRPPYDCGKDSLFVAYYASAELGCHLSLGWPMPADVLDLYVEFRNRTNGIPTVSGNGLLGAMAYFGLDSVQAAEKDTMRDLVLRGGPWTEREREAILKYCESDVRALARLFDKMAPGIDISRALLRGRYMKAVAKIEHNGIPIDTDFWGQLVNRWEDIQSELIEKINGRYHVYEAAHSEQTGLPNG
jgi:DNA polymerase I